MPKKKEKNHKAVIYPGRESFLEVYGELKKKKHHNASWVIASKIGQPFESWQDLDKELFWSYIDALPRGVSHFVLLTNMSKPEANYNDELLRWKKQATELAVLIREHLEDSELRFTFAFTGFTEGGEINGTEHQRLTQEDFLAFESSDIHSKVAA